MYDLDTSSTIFAKKVGDNYPVVGKLGMSTHGHIVSWKKDDYNYIYISTDEKIPVEVWARIIPYGWHVTQDSFIHRSHESWKGVDQKAWFGTNGARVTSTKDEIQQYEEIILTELSLERIKVMKRGRERRYYLKCNWKNVLQKNSDYQEMHPDLFDDDHFKADNDYVSKLPYGFIKGLDKFNDQYRGLPPSWIKKLKKNTKDHIHASVSWVRLHSKIQPGLPSIEMKERIIDRKKSGSHSSKSCAMVITNSKAI
jgi:hypothetical protein